MRRSLLGVVGLLLVGTTVGIQARPASAGLTPTAFSLHAQESGAVGYAVIGASELTETGGVGNCHRSSDATAALTLPAGARVRRAYLSWYAMVMNTQEGTSTISPLDNTLTLNKPTNGSVTVTASITQRETTGMAWRQSFVYDAKVADVTNLLDVNNAAGVYRANVTGGWSEQACPYREENARAWTLHVIYEAPSITTPHAVSLWFGFNAFHLIANQYLRNRWLTGFY